MISRQPLSTALVLLVLAAGAGHAQTQPSPQLTSSCPTEPVVAGQTVSSDFTVSGVGPGTSLKWQVLAAPAGFTTFFSNNNATLTVTGSAPTTSFTISVEVQYTIPSTSFNATGTLGPSSCTITVENPLQISGACPANALAPGTTINIPLSATGGNGRYSWAIVSSGGLVLSSTTGSSTAVQGTMGIQSISFTVFLRDTGGEVPSAPVSFSCVIPVVLPPLTISGACPSSTFAAGGAVNIPLAASGGSGSYVWQINPGNSGLVLSSTSGASTIVQGLAPGAAGQYSFTVTLSDPLTRGSAATFTCTIIVAAPLQITGVCPALPIVTGTAVSIPLTVSGGIAPFRWTVTGPLVPSGSTGSAITLSGVPTTPGSFDISVTVQDSSESPGATFKCTIRVVAPLSITGPPCPVTTVQGRTFSIPLSAAGGTGNYTWSIAVTIASLSAPATVTLSPTTGASVSVTGSSTDPGTLPFTVTLRDDANTPLPVPYVCSLQIAPRLALPPQTLPDGVVNQTYPGARLNAAGGAPPLSFRVSNGNLPPGLQLDPATGAISGTPTQAGTFPFSVSVSDSGDQSAVADYQIRIVAQLLNTTTCPLPVGRELLSYNAPLTATGGTGQFTFALSASTLLPPGLVLNQNAITGTPQGPSDTTLVLQISSGSQTIPVSCQLTILGRAPMVTVKGFFVNSGSPLLTSSVVLDAPVQQDVTGTAVLSFTPDVPNTAVKDNPQVQFCGGNTGDPLCSAAKKDSAGLLRTIPFTIPAGMPGLDLSPALQSNVAGTIQIALTNVAMGGQAITVPPLQFTIARTPPQILSDPQVSFSGDTLQVSLKVSSTTCELSSATAVFTPAAGSELEGAGGGSLTQSIDLTALFRTFTPFAVDATHPTGGCAFTLGLPFTVTGDHSAVARIDLTLKNSVGAAPAVTAVLQQ